MPVLQRSFYTGGLNCSLPLSPVPESMHVVQALSSLGVGGSELVVAELCEYLGKRGHPVTVLGKGGPLTQRVNASGAVHLDWPVGRKRLGTLRYIRTFSDWLYVNQPDIVHAHSRLPAWICWRAIRRLEPSIRPVFITSMHGQYSVGTYSAVMARGDRVIAVSDHIRDFTLQHYAFVAAENIVTIHGGTSRSAFPYQYKPSAAWLANTLKEFPELASRRILLLPGRLSRYKGHTSFLDLIASLVDEYPDIHGVILGQGRPGSRYRAELEGLAHRGGVLDRITFTGLRSDIRDWMASSSIVFNLCSDPPEAFGRIVPEALRLGVPVLAWNHGGVKEILAEMFPPGAVKPNSRRDLWSKTRVFLNQAQAVPDSDCFLLKDSMKKTLALYHDMMGKSA